MHSPVDEQWAWRLDTSLVTGWRGMLWMIGPRGRATRTTKCTKARIHTCVCVCDSACVCVCWAGSCPALKLGWLHQLSAYTSPGLQILTKHFSSNLGTRTSLSLTHTSEHTHSNTHRFMFRYVREVMERREKGGMK